MIGAKGGGLAQLAERVGWRESEAAQVGGGPGVANVQIVSDAGAALEGGGQTADHDELHIAIAEYLYGFFEFHQE